MQRGTSGIVGTGSHIQAFHRRRWWTIPGVVDHLRRSFRLSMCVRPHDCASLHHGVRERQRLRRYAHVHSSRQDQSLSTKYTEITKIFFAPFRALSLIQSFSSTKHTEDTKIYFFFVHFRAFRWSLFSCTSSPFRWPPKDGGGEIVTTTSPKIIRQNFLFCRKRLTFAAVLPKISNLHFQRRLSQYTGFSIPCLKYLTALTADSGMQ